MTMTTAQYAAGTQRRTRNWTSRNTASSAPVTYVASVSQAEVLVEVVCGGLADGRAQDLDDPERDGDLGDPVGHRPPQPTR